MPELKTLRLYVLTALAEIVGCYLPYLWLREGRSVWLLVPAALTALLVVRLVRSVLATVVAGMGTLWVVLGWIY